MKNILTLSKFPEKSNPQIHKPICQLKSCFGIFTSTLVTFSLGFVGILRYKGLLSYLWAFVHQAAAFVCLGELIKCLILECFQLDIILLGFINIIIEIVLWWYIYLKQKDMDDLTSSIANITSHKPGKKYDITVAVCGFIGSPIFSFIARKLILSLYIFGNNNSDIGVYLLVPAFIRKSKVAEMIHTTIIQQIFFGVTFVVLLRYVLLCLALIRSNVELTKDKVLREPLKSWKQCKKQVKAIKAVEKAMSFPVSLALLKVFIHIFTTLIYSTVSTVGNMYISHAFSSVFYAVWFLVTVLMADRVTRKCQNSIDVLFFNKEALGMELDCLKYAEMSKNCILSAWSTLTLNRNLILTAVASGVTYGVIVVQLKNY